MEHVDPEVLALVALGEPVPDRDRAHLAACQRCAAEVGDLAAVVAVGRTVRATDAPVAPSPAVWDRIAAELDLGGARGRASTGTAAVGPAPAPGDVVAQAALEPLPGWSAAGDARVEVGPDGARTLVVTLDGSGTEDGYHEVWLIDREVTRLVSLGVLTGSAGRFTVPPGLDLAEFPVVDVSDEPLDGDPAHSGDSIIRGVLDA